MRSQGLDVFSLRDSVIHEYRNFATSFTTIFADDIREQIEAIYASNRYWPEPLIQINPRYEVADTVEALAAAGHLHPLTAALFRDRRPDGTPGESLRLYRHQQEAIALASSGRSFVVTTGTGSGKSLCFFIPIVDKVVAEKAAGGGRRTRAIVIYPMNALANSQLDELQKFLQNVPDAPVTVARYTGQEDEDARRRVAANPPDILLTNFMMLELLMTRQDELDRKVIDNCAGLRFLVLDELHTYRGRQGADVALLVRRVRERLAPAGLQCIGTSATMASEGSGDDKRRVVARVASTLFSVPVHESDVIVEKLDRVTNKAETASTVKARLGAAVDEGSRPDITDAELRENALAIWAETCLGITWSDPDHGWVRARPLTMTEASSRLSEDAGRPEETCRGVLRDLLLVSSVPERERTGNPAGSPRGFFAFKLHQFISGAGHAYATLEAPGQRRVTVEGQQFLPADPETRLYPVHFCRDCGQEYHPVRLVVEEDGTRRILPRNIDDAPPARPDEEDDGAQSVVDGEEFGFLTLHPDDADFTFRDADDDYPENWLEFDSAGNPRLKSHYRAFRARKLEVRPDGFVGAGRQAWFLPGKFRMCLRCRTVQSSAARDRTRLASLSAEGRSSATTVLVLSALRWMHNQQSGLDPYSRKLLGFTDNRQDAALQAGHFNDFIFVTLLRAAFLAALETAGEPGLRAEEIGLAVQRALGFDQLTPEMRAEWLGDPAIKGVNLQEAETTLRQVLAYRIWFDQRRGWRYTNPNLEQLKLLDVEYTAVREVAADDEEFATAPAILRAASPATREALLLEMLDHLRKSLAVKSQVLDASFLEQVVARSHQWLTPPWGFGNDEKPRGSRWLMVTAPPRKDVSLRDEDLLVRGGARSALGRILRSSRSPVSKRPLWPDATAVKALTSKELDEVIVALLRAAKSYGLVSEEVTPFNGATGWRLNEACVRFRTRTPDEEATRNAFFKDLYATLAQLLKTPGHPLFGLEAREHTAQVETARRVVRERRFRFGPKDQEDLATQEKTLREMGEPNRFLPALFCSPTMELGVDISALNTVYMRNVPPTPANYAQRSGRAGRSGQPALVLTYCSSQGPHDQYFFRDPKAMVHGEVRPPLLDLANRDLVLSHLSAVWLSCTRVPLSPSIADLLVLSDPERPVRPEILEPMTRPTVAEEARERIRRVLAMLDEHLTHITAPWYPGPDAFAAEVVETAPRRFEDAFDRWRGLFLAAEQQRDAARKILDDYSAPSAEKRAARSRHTQALDQIELLRRGSDDSLPGGGTLSSDFYVYRYLATEGFLPGYNFPRLPLMAYIPASGDGRNRQTYLQRPRFVALSEFGPRSLVYHEGRAYRVVRALLTLGPQERANAEARLPTRTVRICMACGAGHFDDSASVCRACGVPLGDAEIVHHIYRIENVATQPAERITANDEERQRQGFELQTTFEWAERDGVLDVRKASARDEEGEIARLAYGAAATITRLNKGLRRRANRTEFGFMLDPVSGYWKKNDDEPDEPKDPTVAPRQRIVPCVQDRKNALLLQMAGGEVSDTTAATVQHALLRGIEQRFQLEEGELLAEPVPSRDARKGVLFYEAAEGGAGVLTRFITDPDALASVARAALSIMHLDVCDKPLPASVEDLADVDGTECVAACYRCLMSYYNQPDHELLDRRDAVARRILLRLARSTTSPQNAAIAPRPGNGDTSTVAPTTIADSKWLAMAASYGIPSPDREPLTLGDASIPLVWREHYAAALLDRDKQLARQLGDAGFEVVIFQGDEATWPAAFSRLAAALGRVS